MTNLITPPTELVQQLWDRLRKAPDANVDAAIAWTQAITEAAQWGADQELEACCKVLEVSDRNAREFLYAARRPSRRRLKERALHELADVYNRDKIDDSAYDAIRLALKALPDD
jgi:hypothetical protein